MTPPFLTRALDRVWTVPVAVAAIVACVTARSLPAVPLLVAVAVVPWVLGVLGRMLPGWLFGVLGIAPVAAIVAIEDLNASMFLGTATLTQLASRAGRPWHLAVTAAVGVALPFSALAAGWEFDPGAIYFAIGDLFGIAIGLLIARTRQLGARLRDADLRLSAVAAQTERTRLARDVHDLVAHSLTVVVLQTAGAREVLRTDPAAAELALDRAQTVARESLDGIREVVGLLRTSDGARAASLDVDRLVETYRTAAVPVELTVVGDPHALPLLVRGTLYRVLQEALANAARYRAPGTGVDVAVSVDEAGVTARITNAGPVGVGSASGGYGLRGLREQVHSIGGTLTGGPDGLGWVVECRLPQTASALSGSGVAASVAVGRA